MMMINMDFNELINQINNLDTNNKSESENIVTALNVNVDNFEQWIDNIFSDRVDMFDMKKLPYLIDELYKTEDKVKFMLYCRLLEATCNRLDFVTNLEKYPLFSAKFENSCSYIGICI